MDACGCVATLILVSTLSSACQLHVGDHEIAVRKNEDIASLGVIELSDLQDETSLASRRLEDEIANLRIDVEELRFQVRGSPASSNQEVSCTTEQLAEREDEGYRHAIDNTFDIVTSLCERSRGACASPTPCSGRYERTVEVLDYSFEANAEQGIRSGSRDVAGSLNEEHVGERSQELRFRFGVSIALQEKTRVEPGCGFVREQQEYLSILEKRMDTVDAYVRRSCNLDSEPY